MKTWMIIFFFSIGMTVNAQKVISNGKAYEVKGKAIFKDGVDITSTLLNEERTHIYKALKNQTKEIKDAEKVRRRLEKAAKNSDKAHKKAAKALKKKQKAQDKFSKATQKLKKNQAKFDKLKIRGKLSPNEEAKWLKKLEKNKKDLEKAKRNLQRS